MKKYPSALLALISLCHEALNELRGEERRDFARALIEAWKRTGHPLPEKEGES